MAMVTLQKAGKLRIPAIGRGRFRTTALQVAQFEARYVIISPAPVGPSQCLSSTVYTVALPFRVD